LPEPPTFNQVTFISSSLRIVSPRRNHLGKCSMGKVALLH
jgi:hypothetical protein